MPDIAQSIVLGGVGPTVTGAITNITSANSPYQVKVTDTWIACQSGPIALTLPTVAQGVQNGQRFGFINYDSSGHSMTIAPGVGDNVEGGAGPFAPNVYALSFDLVASVAGSVITWETTARGTFDRYIFPLQPTLAAGAQGPLSLGWVFVPQGPRYPHGVIFSHDAVLTGGSSTFSITGLAVSPGTWTISPPNDTNYTLFNPGNASRLTAPNAVPVQAGTKLQCTITTAAGFAGPTTCFAQIEFWN